MGDFFGISSQSDTDILVQSYRDTQKYKLDAVTSKKKSLETRRDYFTGLNTKLTNLVRALDKFDKTNINQDFITRKAELSQNDYLTVSADLNAVVGLNTAKVLRVATNDILLSSRMSFEDSWQGPKEPVSFSLTSGSETFQINVNLTDAETNQDAMKAIAKAINETEGINVSSAYVQDTDTTGRLSITSKSSGTAGKIALGASSVLEQLGLDPSQITSSGNARSISAGGSAGYRQADPTQLNSFMQVNGIDIERSSNTVTGVLEGIEFEIKSPMAIDSADLVFETTIDTKAVEDLIKPVLDAFNDTLAFLGSSKEVRRADPSISSLQQRVRSIVSSAVSTAAEDGPRYLMDIGVNIASNGKVQLTDTEKLKSFLEDDPMKVAELFTSSDGIIAKINNSISNFVGEDGLVTNRRLSLSDQIDYQNDRYKSIEKRINQEAENLKSQYSSYLETYYQAQSQFNLLAAFPSQSGGGSGYNSLLQQAY